MTSVRNYANTWPVPQTMVHFFRDDRGRIPFLEWFDAIPPRAQSKCLVRLERLRELGHELRRPEADFLRDGIYELRVGLSGINYRMLYFFHGRNAVIVSHGLLKEQAVPNKEIELAIRNKRLFESDPAAHIAEET